MKLKRKTKKKDKTEQAAPQRPKARPPGYVPLTMHDPRVIRLKEQHG